MSSWGLACPWHLLRQTRPQEEDMITGFSREQKGQEAQGGTVGRETLPRPWCHGLKVDASSQAGHIKCSLWGIWD